MENSLMVDNALDSLSAFVIKNFGLHLSEKEKHDIQYKLTKICSDAPTDDDVKESLDQWKKKVRFSDRRFSFVDVTSIKDVNFSTIFNHDILYEERSIAYTSEPYRRQIESSEYENMWTYSRPDYTQKVYGWHIKGGESIAVCPTCNGGKIITCLACFGRGTHSSSCSSCHGSGKVSNSIRTNDGYKYFDMQCARCGASGRVHTRCSICRGSGQLQCNSCGPTGEVFNFRKVTSELKPINNLRFLGDKSIKDTKSLEKIDKTHVYSNSRVFKQMVSENKMLVSDKLEILVIYNQVYSADTPNSAFDIRVENYKLNYPEESRVRTKTGKVLNVIFWMVIILVCIGLCYFAFRLYENAQLN